MLNKIIIGFIVVTISTLLVWKLYSNSPNTSSRGLLLPTSLNTATSTPIPTPTLAPPQTISIPKLNLTSSIEYVGLDKNLRMDVPQNWDNVAWYQLGPRPGEQGSAVIAGHLDSPQGPAVFYDLDLLQIGDDVLIKGSDGKQLNFEVIDKAVYSDAEFPIATVFTQNDSSRLNLITCEGTYDRQAKNYSDRLVIFTQLKS